MGLKKWFRGRSLVKKLVLSQYPHTAAKTENGYKTKEFPPAPFVEIKIPKPLYDAVEKYISMSWELHGSPEGFINFLLRAHLHDAHMLQR